MELNDIIQPLSEEFKNIFFIKGQRNGRYPYSHSLLLEDCLIDTGISSKHVRIVKRNFRINNVLLSHWHEDHISSNRLLKNAKFLSHAKDKPLIEDVNKFIEYYGLNNTPAEKLLQPIIEGFQIENTKIEKTIEDNEIIEIGDNLRLKVVHTPGHTAGHCCFYEESTKIAFLADIDLTKFAFYGCIDSNLIDFEESIEKLKKLEIEIAITGHDKGVCQGARNIKNELDAYLSIMHKRDERILQNLSEKKPIKIEDLMYKNIIYRTYNEIEKEFEYIAEKIMIQKHFDKLLEKDLIEPKDNGYVLK